MNALDNTACQQLLKEIEKSTAFDRWQSVIRSIDHYEKTVPPHWN
ncbi:hypothetical protein [Oleiphilus messinensis]|nr:hypothetical protein [Oleiphilus messinensis]